MTKKWAGKGYDETVTRKDPILDKEGEPTGEFKTYTHMGWNQRGRKRLHATFLDEGHKLYQKQKQLELI